MKLLAITLSLLFTFNLWASQGLSLECKKNIEQIAEDYNMYAKKINIKQRAAELTDEEMYLLSSHRMVAQITALSCAGIRLIELEQSLRGRLGLISEKKAHKITEETRLNALSLFDELTKLN